MMEATIGRSYTPVSRRVPSTPNCGPGCAAPNQVGSTRSSRRTADASRNSNAPPAATAISPVNSVPANSNGRAIVTRARRWGVGVAGAVQ